MSDRLHCCWIGRDNDACEVGAEWEVWDGIEPYFDHYVHACTEHVGALLTDRPEHRVYRLQGPPMDVPRHSTPGPSATAPAPETTRAPGGEPDACAHCGRPRHRHPSHPACRVWRPPAAPGLPTLCELCEGSEVDKNGQPCGGCAPSPGATRTKETP